MAAATSQPTGFFIGATFKQAWAIFKEQWQLLLMVMAAPVVFTILSNYLESLVRGEWLSLPLSLGLMVVQLLLSMSVLYMVINIARGKKVELADMQKPWGNAINYVLGSLLYGVIVFFGFILLIIPGIILGIKYMFVPYLIVDKGLKPMDALKASAKMTDGVKWDLAGFWVATTLLIWLGLLAFVVGLLVTGPVAALSYALVYDKLVKKLD